MKKSDINHLYRLLGWVRGEIGQTPDEMVSTMRSIADKIGPMDISDECKKDLVEAHDKARLVPKYIRDAVKALEKNCRSGDVVEHGTDEVLQLGAETQSAEIAALKAQRCAYANEFPLNADGEPDTGNIHANIRAMKAEIAALRKAGQKARDVLMMHNSDLGYREERIAAMLALRLILQAETEGAP